MKYKEGQEIRFTRHFNMALLAYENNEEMEGVIVNLYRRTFHDETGLVPDLIYLVNDLETEKRWFWVHESDIIA